MNEKCIRIELFSQISEGVFVKLEFRRGGGVTDFGIPKARGGWAFWNFRRPGGVVTAMPPVGGYGYFLESPNSPALLFTKPALLRATGLYVGNLQVVKPGNAFGG